MQKYKSLYVARFTEKVLAKLNEYKNSLILTATLNCLSRLCIAEEEAGATELKHKCEKILNEADLAKKHEKELKEIESDVKVCLELGLEP